jgi:hypothetical protein
MSFTFFSRTATVAVGVALAAAILYGLVSLGPIALDRWF